MVYDPLVNIVMDDFGKSLNLLSDKLSSLPSIQEAYNWTVKQLCCDPQRDPQYMPGPCYLLQVLLSRIGST